MRSLIPAVMLAFSVSLTACGGDEANGGSEDELRSAAEDFYAGFFKVDTEAVYAMLSKRCQGVYSEEEFGNLIDLANEMYGELEVKINDVEVDGDKGRIEGETGVPALDEASDDEPQWVYEDGDWKSDACD